MKDNKAQPSSDSGKTAVSVRDAEESLELRSGSAFDSRGAMPFADVVGREDGQPGGNNKLIFTAGGKQLSKHITVYQAIQGQNILGENDEGAGFNGTGSSDFFTITYQKYDNGLVDSAMEENPVSTRSASSDARWQQMSLLDSILQGELPCDLEKSNPTYNILALLRVLECLNQLAPRLRVMTYADDFSEEKVASLDELYRIGIQISSEELINTKMAHKLARQIQDPLALCSDNLPSWCYQTTSACPFLFPFDTRRQYLYSTAFELSRALYWLQQQQNSANLGSTNERETRIGRLQRQKAVVSRNHILESAMVVMGMHTCQKDVIEFQFFDEVGTGLGPTLEFYTLLSRDLQMVGLGLWRSD